MRVLQFCLKPPYPTVDGGTMAMNSITEGLMAMGHSVKVLSVCSDKHPVSIAADDPYRQRTDFEAVHLDLSIHPLAAATALLCGESYNVKRFENKRLDDRLAELLHQEQFDVIHVESLFLTPYLPTIRRCCKTPVVLRAHNVEHLIWRQMALAEPHAAKRWYLKKLALALRAYELEHLNDYDGIACITQHDADTLRQLGCRRAMAAIPFGVSLPAMPHTESDTNKLFHIGSMDWRPNDEAIRWFLGEVWPMVHSQMPHLTLHIAGRRMAADLLNAHYDGVDVAGEVPDATAFMADKQINIVPLKSGSGIRIKIIEAMALAKTVITTTVGARGIDYTDGHDLLIADTPQQFVEAIKRCTTDKDFCKQVGNNARRLIAQRYDNNTLTEKLILFYNKILDKTLS